MDEEYIGETPVAGDGYSNDKDELLHGDDVNDVKALGDRIEGLIQRQMSQLERITDDLSFKSSLPLYRLMIEYVDMLGEMLRRQDHLLDMGTGNFMRRRKVSTSLLSPAPPTMICCTAPI